MREALNIREVAALRPDFMGFIFYKHSARFVGEDFIVPIDLPSEIQRVGVFVNETVDAILQVARKNRLDFAQLHGQESPEQCAALVDNELGVIKTFSVDGKFDFAKTAGYAGVTNFFLFDASGPMPGGNGRVFDWQCLRSYDQQVPFFLSGGITPANIHEVSKLEDMNLYAVDVNSGVETAPGLKDKDLVKKLMIKLNAYDV